MELQIKKNARYALACVTSMGVRITPADRMAVHNSNQFTMQATSAETNVLNVASALGRPCLAMTKFVEGSPVAAFIRAQLRARNIFFEGLDVPQGGPWGYRHQFNIADSGFGLRAPGCGTTGLARWAARSAPRALTWNASLSAKAWGSCICRA